MNSTVDPTDKSFGKNGTALVTFNLSQNEANHEASVTCIALQPDGKIVAGGYYSKQYQEFVLVRFLSNGVVDSSFGDNGVAMPKVKKYGSTGNDLLVQPDGKILVGGSYSNSGFSEIFFLERLLPNGNIDSSFAGTGQFYGDYGRVHALALQPDGKILAAGDSGNTNDSSHFLIRRFLPNGTPDTRFGNKGIVDASIGYRYDYFTDIALQPDGKMVVSGGTYVYPGYPHFIVARYNSNGTLDRTFGNRGYVITLLPSGNNSDLAEADKIMLWNDKIIAAGYNYASSDNFDNYTDLNLVAYNTNGTIDSSFATNGIQQIGLNYNDIFGSAALQTDGNIILMGMGRDRGQTYETRNVLRYYGYPAQSLATAFEKDNQSVSTVASSIRMYPNPASDYIIITGLPANMKASITIIDGLGKAMALYNTNNTAQYKVDVSKLTAGVYYVRVNANDRIEVMPFVKE